MILDPHDHAGLETTSISDLIEMDKNYLNQINLRESLMRKHTAAVIAAEECVKPAVHEFYEFLVNNYLPIRFPPMFKFLRPSTSNPSLLHNLVTGDQLPLEPLESVTETLRLLGGLIEDDCLFLLPSDDGDGYTLKGFVTCFPSGFDTREKLNLKLRDIHGPVPGYKQKLEKSMDRYFEKLPVGKYVKRVNVSSWQMTLESYDC